MTLHLRPLCRKVGRFLILNPPDGTKPNRAGRRQGVSGLTPPPHDRPAFVTSQPPKPKALLRVYVAHANPRPTAADASPHSVLLVVVQCPVGV
jgi:hypothetical protein